MKNDFKYLFDYFTTFKIKRLNKKKHFYTKIGNKFPVLLYFRTHLSPTRIKFSIKFGEQSMQNLCKIPNKDLRTFLSYTRPLWLQIRLVKYRLKSSDPSINKDSPQNPKRKNTKAKRIFPPFSFSLEGIETFCLISEKDIG